MKLQSSLLILAAVAGSATAANKRKRVFKIYSREEIQAAEGRRSLQGGKNEKNPKPEPEVLPEVESMSMTLAPVATPVAAMSMMTTCAFCSGKEMDADFDLGVQGQTCGSVQIAVSTMAATNPNCALAKQAEALCCPATTTSATVAMSLSTSTEAAVIETTTTEAASVPVPVPVPSPPEPA